MRAYKHKLSLIDNFVRDKHGKIVTWQPPNLPIIGWFVFFAASHLLHAGHMRSGLEFISSAFLFTWAYLELKHGANYFRRSWGIVIMFLVIGSHFK